MLTKQAIDISFAQGLDTKTDPKRIPIGKFETLQNKVFTKTGLLQKRNGYPKISILPDTNYSYLTTTKTNLTALGNNIAAYNNANETWVTKGSIQPLSLNTLSLIRNNLNQTQCDSVIAPNGLICTVYLETDGSTTSAKYVIADSISGQNIVAPTVIPVASGTVTGGLRVFYLGTYFVIVFTNVITAVSHLQYVAVNSINPSIIRSNTDIASSYISATTLSWDGIVINNRLFIAYNTTTGGQAIKVTYLTNTFTVATAVTFAGRIATIMSMAVDAEIPFNPVIYASFYDSGGSTGYTLALDSNLNTVMTAQQIISSGTILNMTSIAKNGVCTVAYEVSNSYSFTTGTGNSTNYISTLTITLATTTVSSPYIVVRSVGLASKAFAINDIYYYMGIYSSSYQSTYFLINASESRATSPVISAKLAYSNSGGYLTKGLPSITVQDSVANVPYLIKDLIQAANKDTNVPTGTQTAGIYSQTGINLASFTFGTNYIDTAEIGNDLHISGGFLWMYDAYLPLEHNFFLWPDIGPTSPPSPINSSAAVWADTGGSIVAKPDGATNTNAYFYQYTYEWTDNQGNAFKSAPSIPISVTTTGAGTSGSNTLNIPTLRLTMKVANPVKVVIYRWSVAQQIYYQTTSITSPLLNSTTVDSVQYVDTHSDATILGNNILYTTGGVIENVNAPASDILALFDTRLWLLDSENRDLLWYSKQVIQTTPVEMSDLFTVYVPPATATIGSTGPIKSLAPMDDKLIIGKSNAFLYINGNGPDNTGANNQYSEPIFITSTVGCSNQRSLVLTPNGLMFQSDKGIWLLDRGLQASYIGSPVERFVTGATVNSAVLVPETTQVRFTLDTGITLMYDYFYEQWGTFDGVSAVSSCIFQGVHTFINSSGIAYKEQADTYLDGSNPVLLKFKTGPIRLGDLQNYQRAYFFYLLGTYLSPHKLQVNIYYDYETSPSQSVLISPVNFSTPFGSGASQTPYGQGNPFGGPSNLEDWRIFLEKQRCMSFAIEVQEIFDPTFGVAAGAGLTLSGINAVLGFKKEFRPQSTQHTAG